MKLTLNSIQKSFGEKKVLKDASFTFVEGKIYGLLGRNGSGKTTLFNCLSDEVQADGGSAVFTDENGKTGPLQPEDVGYVFSTPTLPEFLTAREFLKFYLEVNGQNADSEKSIDDWFDTVSILPEDRDRLIKGYSHGMKNKLQMVACFIAKPPIILLDEPLTSLDIVVAHEMKILLENMKKKHIQIFSTHILQLATDLCDEIVILNDGKLEAIDSETLHSSDFEEKLIAILKEEEVYNG